ncbi:hypothetical protein L596_027487 [Steinernema carpocapsae]|uniref:Uncharacterized protein n=1 Tax=Steinernema carpocapsae TaxID=34508 RepID=A0A4U5LVM1_STECR|nr:hypothetical protein L596_027487 [Steinernema carpocapsae]
MFHLSHGTTLHAPRFLCFKRLGRPEIGRNYHPFGADQSITGNCGRKRLAGKVQTETLVQLVFALPVGGR